MSVDFAVSPGSIPKANHAHIPQDKVLQILHIDNIIGETCASYNEHVLARVDAYKLTVCTFFPSSIKVPLPIELYAGTGSVFSYYRKLLTCLRKNNYDVIHIHAPHVGVFTLLFLLFYNFRLLKSTVYTVHNSFQNYSRFHRLLLVLPFLFFNRVVHCSWSSYHSFPKFYRALAGSRRTAVPNGVDVHRIDRIIDDVNASQKSVHVDDKFNLLSIGRLIPIKSPSTLLESMKKADLPNSRLQYLGDGHLRESLASEIEQADMKGDIELRGIIPRDEVYRELVAADLYVSTSLGEGLPIAVMEAMCCACPVILSDIPPHRELAEQVDFIPLVKTEDSAGFSSEIKRIFNMSQPERAELGEKCRQLVVDHFSLDAMHKGYAALYTSD